MKTKDKATWVIKLPPKAKILVEIGDKVKTGDKLATFNNHRIETFDYSGNLSKMGDEKREELNNLFKEKMVNEGEVFFNLGVFKNKICFPLTGLCLGFDEFKNLKIEIDEKDKKEIFSPVEAKVSKIEDGKMVLEFDAKEYSGQGLNGLKAWGEGKVQIVNDIKSLNYELDNNILFTNNLDKAFLLKAQVVGVKAVVFCDNEEFKETDINLPFLRLEEEKWKDFIKENLDKNKKILVNAKMDKLLLVVE